MKTLSKPNCNQKQGHVDRITSKRDVLDAAIEKYNAQMDELRAVAEAAKDELNEAISDADAWREEINGEQEDYFADRSEKWQEGDAGQSYSAWKESWSVPLELVEIEFPESLESPEVAAVDQLENLADEVE